jgi:hypothetical protein
MFGLKRWKIKRLTKKLKTMRLDRQNSQPRDEILKREVLYYFELAKLYKSQIGQVKYPYAELMMLECYRAAASLDDALAHYNLGQYSLGKASFRVGLQKEGLFESAANEKRIEHAYHEAHAHLLQAEELGHIEAKRLRGLCFINGWGVEPDSDKGFELIVASIEKEGSWDRVPQIFAAMGLNKPEFFSAIMQRRK